MDMAVDERRLPRIRLDSFSFAADISLAFCLIRGVTG